MYKKVIVGIDFSDKSERAVHATLKMAKSTQGTVVLLHALAHTAEEAQKVQPGSEASARHAVEARLRGEAEQLSKHHGQHVDYGVVVGPAAHEIVEYVKKWGGDVIVVASEARSGLDRLLLGSVAEKLVATSPVPVLVVGPASH